MSSLAESSLSGDAANDSMIDKTLKLAFIASHGLEQLLDNFYFETQAWLFLDSMTFANEQEHIRYQVGHNAQHQCTYRVFSNHNFLGDIKFTRKEVFENDEIEMIESFVALLAAPLARTLNHQDEYFL